MVHPLGWRMSGPSLLVSDGHGRIVDVPAYGLVGMSRKIPHKIRSNELVRLPEGSDLFEIPGRLPVAVDRQSGTITTVERIDGRPVVAVAAFLAPANVQHYRAAWVRQPDAPVLPLYAYTAVGWWKGNFWVPASRIDPDERQDARHVDCDAIERAARKALKRFPGNRLVQHLVENCVRRYGCPAARNFAMNRWEFPIPVSRGCNARCIGCLSHQTEGGITAAMERISFTPTVDEIVEYTVPHLEHAPRAVVSFGQGCEGEPLTEASLLEAAIVEIRKRTTRGIINLNTNGCDPSAVERLCKAGLDSMRVSLNSCQESFYTRYFRPHGFCFEDVLASMRTISRFKRWLSINYFIFPGFTDSASEEAALERVLQMNRVSMIQTRNLNIDPDIYIDMLDLDEYGDKPKGIARWIAWLEKEYPHTMLGYFNPPREVMLAHRLRE